ncbi:MAG: RtcB family protein [Desulfobacterales bacterium]|nr:RtcB family protein [Desulfobacterales bacterium]
MEWIRKEDDFKVPVKSWCQNLDDGAWKQATDLAKHPVVFQHVALMPDCHQGYGMPIGGVIACVDAVIPNAVGVDIGCGMGAVKTNILAYDVSKKKLRAIINRIKKYIPCGEGHCHEKPQIFEGIEDHIDNFSHAGWFSEHVRTLASKNLGTLGGGNHFIEIQAADDEFVWLMIHSGSRHLGNVIARFYSQIAINLNEKWHSQIPNRDLAFLPVESKEGKDYIREMNFALSYAKENRNRIMKRFMEGFSEELPNTLFEEPVNIHHNYANLEHHFGKNVWIHRKGATSAREKEIGIIPGSMGTPSYIVEGIGNIESFNSCSHGAGRSMGRNEASRNLSLADCDKAMDGIVFDRWTKVKRGKEKGQYDLGEAPQAYKDIDTVIRSEADLVKPLIKLKPLAVVKG